MQNVFFSCSSRPWDGLPFFAGQERGLASRQCSANLIVLVHYVQSKEKKGKSYPVWTQLREKEMFNPVHVILGASMLNQAHCTSNMSRDTALRRAFHTLPSSLMSCIVCFANRDHTPRRQVEELLSPM
jgi:hypothetical protein